MGLVSDKFPAFVIEDTISGEASPFGEEEEITGKNIDAFVERYFEGREKGNVPVQTVVSDSEWRGWLFMFDADNCS